MKKGFAWLCRLAILVLCVALLCVSAFSATESASNAGVTVKLTTPKDTYNAGEEIGVRLDVVNYSMGTMTGKYTITLPSGIALSGNATGAFSLSGGNKQSFTLGNYPKKNYIFSGDDVETDAEFGNNEYAGIPPQTSSVSNYTDTLYGEVALAGNTADKISLADGNQQPITLADNLLTVDIYSVEDVKSAAKFGGEASASVPSQSALSGNGFKLGLWIAIAVLACAGVVVLVVTRRKARSYIAMLLCICTLLPMLPPVEAQAATTATEAVTLETSKTIKIGSQDVTITAKVEYTLQTAANADPYLFKAVDGGVALEAEDCYVDNYSFVTKSYAHASGGKVAYCAKTASNNPYELDASLERQMGFDFVADETAYYTLWVRAYVPNNHIWIYPSLNGAPYRSTSMHAYGLSQSSTDLVWQNIGQARAEKGEVVEVKLRTRGTGSYIDKIMITSNLAYVPSGADALPPVADWYAATEFDTEYYADPKVYPTMGDHPRLFFHQDEVEEIRKKFYDPFNADVARALCETAAINFDGVWNVENTNNYNGTDLGIIECKAFYYAIFKNDPNPETRERAIKYGKQAIVAIKNCQQTFTYTGNALRARGHVMYVTALVYDWCYDLLTQKDKARLASGGQLIANGMEIGFPPIGQEVVNGHGAEKQLLRDWLAFSIAIYDEFPTVYELVGGRFFEEYVPARNKYWATAQYHYQGTKYGAYRSVADIMGQLLIHRMADVDYTDDPNFVYDEGFSKLAYQWIYAKRPDGRFMRDGDGSATFVVSDYYALLFYSAMLYKDPVLYEEFLSFPEAMTTYSYAENLTPAMILCLQDPSVENMEAGALPYTHYHSSPYGMLVARTGLEYDNINSNDVIANMKIQESYVGGHQNREAGSFQIYYKGMLTGDSGFYGNFGVDHDRYYQTQSISKNTVAITSAANPKGWQTSAENTKNPGNSGTVLGVEYGNNIYRPEYSYISGDVAKSYDRNVLEAVRSMLFLNLNLDGYTDTPGALIVLDQIKTTETNSKKSFLLHTHAEPTITNKKVITVENTESGYNGRLTNQILYVGTADKADANYTVQTIGGEGKEFWVGDLTTGQNYPNEKEPVSENEAGWGRVEISTTTTAKNQTDYMLNVMYVSKANGSKTVIPATLVCGTGLMGAQILGHVAMFNMNGNTRISGTTSFQIPAATGYSQFEVNVAGMKAGTWRVTAGNNSFDVVATQEGGMLYFTAPAGTVTMSYIAEPVITEDGVENTFGKFDTSTPDAFNKVTVTSVAKLPGISLVKNYDDLVGSNWKTKALPATVSVTLSNGETAEVSVKWDVTPLGDVSKEGKYMLTGKLTSKDYVVNDMVAKQFVTIHEYSNLISSNADFEKTATASYGALYFPNWGVYDKYFDQYNVTAVDNGEYGQAAKYIARTENGTDDGTIVKHSRTETLLENIKATGSGQYLLSIDAWSDTDYPTINVWPQLNLKYGSTAVSLKGTQRPFAGYSRTASGVVDIDITDLTSAEFAVCKNVTQVPYVCVDNAAVVPAKLFVDIENCEHNYEFTGTTDATCTEDAVDIYTCSICLDSYTVKIADATGHNYNKKVVTAPTCTAAGYTSYICDCGHSYKGNTVAATGHSYNKKVVTPPTCITAGYTTYTCDCGYSYKGSAVTATGHNYDEVVTAPTCAVVGYTTYTCACGHSYKGNIVAALGHSYTYIENGDSHIVGCRNCDLNETVRAISIVQGYDDYVGADWTSKLDLPKNVTWEDPAKYVDVDTVGLYVIPGKDANGKAASFVVKVRAYENLIPTNADFETTATASYGAPWFPDWTVSNTYFNRDLATSVNNGKYGQAAKFIARTEKGADDGVVATHSKTAELLANINAAGAGQYLISIDAWTDAAYSKINVWPQLTLKYGSSTVTLKGTQTPFAASSQTVSGIVDIDVANNDTALSSAAFGVYKNTTQVPYVCLDNAAVVLLKQAFVPDNLLTITNVAAFPGISLVENYDDLMGSDWQAKTLPTTVSVTLSDGTTAVVPVEWDLTPLGDMSKPGKYILKGKLATNDYIANGLVAKQLVNIHEYRNLIPNAEFETTATASYGALHFPGWGVYDKFFDKYKVTSVNNGQYGQAAKYIARMENVTDNGEIVKHSGRAALLENIKATGSGQYLISIDAWSDAKYSRINFWPQLNLGYGSIIVAHKGVQTFFDATSQTASDFVEIDAANLTSAEFVVLKNMTQVPYICLDNAALIPVKLSVDAEECKHNYKVTGSTDATCTMDGITTYTCSLCQDSYAEKTADATGHSYKTVVTAPTCTTAGYTTYTCACGYSNKGNEVAATGHDYIYSENGDSHIVGCKNCDLNETVMAISIVQGYDDYVGADWASTLDLPKNVTWEDPAKYIDVDTVGFYAVPGKDANGKAKSFIVKVHAYENLIPTNADFETTATATYGAPWFPGWAVSNTYFNRDLATPVNNGQYGQAAKFIARSEIGTDNGIVATHSKTADLLANINAAGAGQYLISIDAWTDAAYSKINVWPQLTLKYGSSTVTLKGTQTPFAASSQTVSGIVDIDVANNGTALSAATFGVYKNTTQVPYVCLDNAAVVLLKQAFVPENLLAITSVAELPGISLVENYDDLMGSDWKTKALPATVSVTLSDGTTAVVPVEWDVTPLGDMSKQGKYILKGKLATKDYVVSGLVAKQFVNIHEYRNLITNNADFEKTATASYGALYFPYWGAYNLYFNQDLVTPVDNGQYGQAAKYIARMENVTDNGEIVKHTGKTLLENIKTTGSGQYLISIDAWSDAKYSEINFWPQLKLGYSATTVILKGTQTPFAAASQTASGFIDIDVADLTSAELAICKNVTQVPYVCLDNAALIPLMMFVDAEDCEHNYEVTGTTDATCTEIGTTTYTCSLCLDSYTEKTAEAIGHSYKTVVTAPTCTAAGYTTYTCACGDTYKGNTVAATGHNYTYTENGDKHTVGCKNCNLNNTAEHKYENGKCICGAEEKTDVHEHTWGEGVVLLKPTYAATGKIQYTCSCNETKTEELPALFYGTTVNLGNTLDLTFYFYDKFADENGKAVFVRERADGTTETTEALLSTFKKNSSFYEIIYPGVAAKEMSDNVHLTIYNANGDVVSETKTDSVRAYAMRMLRNVNYANDAKLRTMLVDMLNYGAAAQVAFDNYGINDLANKLLTAEEKALATPAAQAYSNNRTISGEKSAYYGSTCILESRISFVMFVYSAQIGEGAYAKVTYTDYLGEEQTVTAERINMNGFYQFNLDKIVVADSRCMLKWDFYNGNDELVVSVEDSLESYIARVAADNPWLEKVMIFTDSARAYLQK